MFKTDSEKIIIISSPRTGSTSLGQSIAIDNNKEFYCEPGHNKISFESFVNIQSDPNSKFVLKLHALDFYDHAYNKSLRKDVKIQWIRIRRRNIIEQIASEYIAVNRKKWWYNARNEYDYDSNIIEINKDLIAWRIRIIKKFNKFLDTFETPQDIKFDKDLWYEDIEDELRLRTDISSVPTPLPENYSELLLNIEKLL
jgi:hypothetical protein